MSFRDNLFSTRKDFINSFTVDEKLINFLLNNEDIKQTALIILHLSKTYIGKLSKKAKQMNFEELIKASEEQLWPEFYLNTLLTEEDKKYLLKIKNIELVNIINNLNFGKFIDTQDFSIAYILKDNRYVVYDKIKYLQLENNNNIPENKILSF